MERRIAAILAADMVGFSRLTELDETGTLVRQKQHRLDLIDPTIQKYNGRIIKLTGDGMIAEFSSVVEATQCAVIVQGEMAARESDVPEDRRIQYRIAVHLGDIVFDDGDIYGDGVNIAARLEGIAEPGGIVVSGTAYDMLKSQVDVGYRTLGEKKLKNIERPVRVYQVTAVDAVAPRRIPRRGIISAALIAIVAAVFLGWLYLRPDFTPVDPAQMALELPAKPSIAVLPYEMRGETTSQDWLADGLTESIISTLSLSPDMIVMSRATMQNYKNRGVTASDVARELGVRYILSGSVLRSGDTLRVTTELADAIKGRQVWSLQNDSAPDDLIALQDSISRQIFEELSVSLTVGEGARTWIERAGGFETYVAVIKGRAAFQEFSPDGHANAERIWSKLYRSDPDNAFFNYLMGYIHWQKVVLGISTDSARDWGKSTKYSNLALEIEEFGEGYTLAALLKQGSRSFDEAIALADKAISLSPGSGDANALAGLVKIQSGQPREGLALMERGMRLEPDYPDYVPQYVNLARMELGLYAEAKKLAEEVLASDTKDVRAKPNAAAVLTAIAVFEGDMEAARVQAANLLKLHPQASGAATRTNYASFKQQDFIEKYANALVQAGVPEQ